MTIFNDNSVGVSTGDDSMGHGGMWPLFTNGWARGGGPCVEKKQQTKLYWPSRKRSPKRLIVGPILVQPDNSGGHDKKLCQMCVPQFRIRSGAIACTDTERFSLSGPPSILCSSSEVTESVPEVVNAVLALRWWEEQRNNTMTNDGTGYKQMSVKDATAIIQPLRRTRDFSK